MSFRYLAYGSNLWVPHMRSRCPSATPLGKARIEGWRLVYDKPSTDGSAKLNIRPDPSSSVEGVVYRVEDRDRRALDLAEPLYTPIDVFVDGKPAITYTYEGRPTDQAPFDWYVATAALGAASHDIDPTPYQVEVDPDPVAPAIRPATVADLDAIQSILSRGLAAGTDRYYIHPGDFAWWVYHDDPRHPDHLSIWIQDDTGFVVVDSLAPHEVSVFTVPGGDRLPLLDWAQRRLAGTGEIGWIADTDETMLKELRGRGYHHTYLNKLYRWDLDNPSPEPELPAGWAIRPMTEEGDANARRAASHAAFESTMPDVMHLQRYLDFMRSPVYDQERDLMAVSPDGRVAAFMIWWPDDSGVAQIEPFGTHPDFQRTGVGRALIYLGLAEMRTAGMRVARVLGDEMGAGRHFYEAVGFEEVGTLRWWSDPLAA